MRRLFASVVCLCFATTAAADPVCRPGFVETDSRSNPDGTVTVTCSCLAPSEEVDGSCVPVMRAKTRAECVRDAGANLRAALRTCRSPIVSCLVSDGVPETAAGCVASAVTTGILFARRPSGWTGAAFAQALVGCRVGARDIARSCEATFTDCEDPPLRAHQVAVDECNAQ